jgi:Putative bacterial sensory transduction regulator
MTTESQCTNLIERYLCDRGWRYSRGQYDAEYFFLVKTRSQRLHVHLGVSPDFDDVLVIRVSPGRFFSPADRPQLTHVSDQWNQQNREVTAIVHGSSDPRRIGVVARKSRWISETVSFEDFASIVDRTIADAFDLFGELTLVVEQPATVQPLLRAAG